MNNNFKKYMAEFLGTAILVFLGCGTAVALTAVSPWGAGVAVSGELNAAVIVGISLAFGLALAAIIYIIGHISGGHVNPAVSVAMAIRKKISWIDCVYYVIAQVLGAIAGAAILFSITKLVGAEAMGTNSYTGGALAGLEAWEGILAAGIIEVVLTFIFVLTIFGVTERKENGHATGLIIGLTLAAVHLFGIMFTGTSVNPARSFGPALFAGADAEALKEVWLFIVAPLVGGILAAFASMCLHKGESTVTPVVEPASAKKAAK